MNDKPRKLSEILDGARLQAHKQLGSMSDESLKYITDNYDVNTRIGLNPNGKEATVDIRLVKKDDSD